MPRDGRGTPTLPGKARKGSPGNQDARSLLSNSPLATEAPVEVSPKPAPPHWLASVFSNTYDWKEKVLKIYHPLRLLFPVKLSGFSLSFLFGMKRSGLFWQPEGATKTDFLRAAWVPPIKAICRWPASQRHLSARLKGNQGDPLSPVRP